MIDVLAWQRALAAEPELVVIQFGPSLPAHPTIALKLMRSEPWYDGHIVYASVFHGDVNGAFTVWINGAQHARVTMAQAIAELVKAATRS